MIHGWGRWKRFPDANNGDTVEAPIGPGIYEVRHTLSGRVVAFGSASNIARALSTLKVNSGISSSVMNFILRKPLVPRRVDLEYRICPAASHAEAKIAARRLLGLRQSIRRKRMTAVLPVRGPS
jgi:hypothetical protein